MRLVALGLLALSATADSQDPDRAPVSRGDRFRERSLGFSWHSPATGWGSVSHRRVYLTGIRTERVLGTHESVAVSYFAELVPLAVVERTAPNGYRCRSDYSTAICRRDYSARLAVGAGGSPIGVKLYFDRMRRLRPYASVAAGGLVFSNEVPSYNSRRLNFAGQASLGFDHVMRNGRAATFGYRYHHISNGGTGRLNPGLDAHVVYIGVLDRRRR